MTIQLTSNVTIPNINRIKVTRVDIREEDSTATVVLEALQVGGNVAGKYKLDIRNGAAMATSIMVNPAPTGVSDLLILTQKEIASAFDNLFAAWLAAGSKANRLKAAETQGLADGWIDATLAGTVG